jgi:hypothetical protein
MAGRKLNEIDLGEVERLSGLGLTEKQIHEALGIPSRTFYRRKADEESLREALSKGKSKVMAEVSNRLYELCRKGNVTAIIWFEKTRFGFSDHVTLSGDQENPLMVATRDSVAGFAPGSVGDSAPSGTDSGSRSRETVGQNGSRRSTRRH